MLRVLTKRRGTVERGQSLYESGIRRQVEPVHNGKFLALDVKTGDYAIDDNMLTALDRLRTRHPKAEIYVLRIGYPTAVTLGGSRVLTR
jgi:hypothetical protein